MNLKKNIEINYDSYIIKTDEIIKKINLKEKIMKKKI